MSDNIASCPYSTDYDFHKEKYYCELKGTYVSMDTYNEYCYKMRDYEDCPTYKKEH